MKKLWKKFIVYIKKDKRIFAEGKCFQKLFAIFLIGSVLGAYYEQIFDVFWFLIYRGEFVWRLHRGVIYGPFNVIYGFGAVVMVVLLVRDKDKWYHTFLYGCLLGGGLEYALHFLQETFTGTTSWNYSANFLNIHGRTTIPFMIVWGLFGVVFVKYVYPFISKRIERIPYNLGNLLTRILVVFMIFNMAISWTAIIRQTLRRNHIPPFTPIGKFYDIHYTDEFLSKYFPNMNASEG